MTLKVVAALALAGLLAGCVSLHPVETTPEGILRSVAPGDTVRLTTRDRGELTMRVLRINDRDIRGRVKGDTDEVLDVRFDRIETLDLERPNLKKAMLTTFLPAVIAAAIICNHQDCETSSVLSSTQ